MLVRLQLEDFHGPQRHVSDGREIWVKTCPVCGSSGWKTYINVDQGLWFCHAGGHGKGGAVAGARVRWRQAPSSEYPAIDLPDTVSPSPPAVRFLARRGLDEAALRHFSIQEGNDDRVLGRVIIPFFNRRGDCIYWTARSYSKVLAPRPKYVGAAVDRPLFVAHGYGGGDSVHVLVEGPLDAIAVALSTGHTACAIGGTRMTARQRAQLFSLTPRELVVMLDGDATGKGIALARQVRHLAPVHVVGLVPGEDPGNIGEGDLCSRISRAFSRQHQIVP